MDLLEILSDVPSSGSGTGNSWYMEQCAARHTLDELYPVPSSFDARVGTLVHKLLELHYKRALTNVIIPLDDLANFEIDVVQEALRVYSAYARYFPENEFDVLGCEVQFPTTPEQADVMGRLVVRPYTIRPDMIVHFGYEQSQAWAARRKTVVVPGVYLLDHKTHKKADNSAVMSYIMGPQVPLYTRCYNALWDVKLLPPELQAAGPCQGLIINSMVRHSEMTPEPTPRRAASFHTSILEVGSDLDVAVYSEFYNRQKVYLASGAPNPTQCRSFGRICEHLQTGRCNRLNIVQFPVTVD